jgi:CRP-like cAMP-binding protein
MSKAVQTIHHRGNRLLAALEPEDFAHLQPHLELIDLQRGQVLYETDETLQHTYFPHDAMVSLVTIMAQGRTVEMAVFGREGLFGLVSALVSREALGRYVVHVPGTASRIEIERIQDAITACPNLRRLLMRYTEALFATVLLSVACNSVHSVEARCCRWLLSTRDRIEQDALPLTHEALAALLGAERSTVSLIMKKLQTAGLIVQGRGIITVTNREGLEEAACECYGRIRQRFERVLPETFRSG